MCLLKLSEPFEETDSVSKSLKINQNVEIDDICQVAGWGRTEKRRSVRDLRTTKVRILSSENCSLYEDQFNDDSMICAGRKVIKSYIQSINYII